MALVTHALYKPGAATPYATIDDDGNINATGELRVDGVAVASIDTSGNVAIADTYGLVLGTGSDDTIGHNGTLTTWTHTTGDLLIDNTLVTGSTIFRLGTDTTATSFEVKTDSNNIVLSVTPSSATAATLLVAGVLDLNGTVDQDAALTGAGLMLDVAGTLNHATAAAAGISSDVRTVTTVHSSGTLAAFKATITSLAGDTGGDFAALQIVSTDGGGTTPTHVGIYCDDPLDALIKVAADGDGGFVVGATMTVSPESTAESGYIKVAIGATIYQIPIYAA